MKCRGMRHPGTTWQRHCGWRLKASPLRHLTSYTPIVGLKFQLNIFVVLFLLLPVPLRKKPFLSIVLFENLSILPNLSRKCIQLCQRIRWVGPEFAKFLSELAQADKKDPKIHISTIQQNLPQPFLMVVFFCFLWLKRGYKGARPLVWELRHSIRLG